MTFLIFDVSACYKFPMPGNNTSVCDVNDLHRNIPLFLTLETKHSNFNGSLFYMVRTKVKI